LPPETFGWTGAFSTNTRLSMKAFKKEYNPYKEAYETYYWDEVNQKMTIKNTFDIGDILKNNKRQQNASLDSRYGKQMMHHVAEIPNVFIAKFLKEHNLDVFSQDPKDQRKLRRLLESPEYRFLKTTVKKLWRPT
jgi:hypothetical protein